MVKRNENLDNIISRIEKAANYAGKNLADIHIIAASKTRSIKEIRDVLSSEYISVAGENRVQEFLSKYVDDVCFDFIGQLQTNKVKYIIDKVRMIHSVDRESLVKEINRQAQKHNLTIDVLIEVNSGKEEDKGGIFAEEVQDFAEQIAECNNLRLRGLMAVAPIAEDYLLKEAFLTVNREFFKLKEKYPHIDYLSMGMSDDFELAIECGSNMIRLGRILFD